MELTGIQNTRKVETPESAERQVPAASPAPHVRQGAEDTQISEEARRLANARAEAEARIPEGEAGSPVESTTGLIAVRFGPAPLTLGAPGEGGAAANLREGLRGRAQLPQVGQLLHRPETKTGVDEQLAAARAEEPEALPLFGSDQGEEELELIGDAEPVRSEDVRTSFDPRADRSSRELSRERDTQDLNPSAPPGSLESEALAASNGDARELRETRDLERGTDDADLQAVSATAPAGGVAQNAKSEQVNRAELLGTSGDEAEAAERLERRSVSRAAPIEATREDAIVSRFLDQSPTAERSA